DSSFDGMTDGIETSENKALKQIDSNNVDFTKNNTWGIEGFWIVGSTGRGGDRFEQDKNKVTISNCCGSCTLVAI
ncbi:MAG: hypothetical protein GY828_01195, partial [Candidatus Gracilibacteria bacterium]|nr:hypothetical protein [Candidatus Gracilibacteria bacterium]